MPNDWKRRETVDFCYIYPATPSSLEHAYNAAASALFALTATGMTLQQSFQSMNQMPLLPSGILCTGLITVPNGESLRSYYINQLGYGLLTKWITENELKISLLNLVGEAEPAVESNVT